MSTVRSILTNTAIVLALAGSLALNLFLWNRMRDINQPPEKVISKSTDTIYHIREIHTTVLPAPEPIVVEQVDTLFITDTLRLPLPSILSRRIYQDSFLQDGIRLDFKHSIIGALENSQYKMTIPERTVINHTETATIRMPRYMAYPIIGVDFALDRADLRAGGLLIYDDYALGYSYGFLAKSHSLHFGVRMWQK
jgi:hypothetical protein